MTQWNQPQGGGQYERPGGYQQQPGYGQPGYGQPGYGQPGYAPPPGHSPYGTSDSFGIVGTVMALLGGVALVVSFTALTWFADFPNDGTFGSVHDLIGKNDSSANGFASAYFGWLAWVFLIVVVIAGVLASVPSPALRIFRIIGIVVGLAAAGLSFLAIKLGDGDYTQYIKHARVGFYLAVVAFIIAGIGAAIGPRKV